MDIKIEPAAPQSVAAIVRLMRDFAAYEKLSEYCTVTEQDLQAAMFGDDGFVRGITARDGETIVAFAIFFKSFSTFRGERGYFLEDLYIDGDYRGRGIGLSLLRAVAAAAQADGARRLDFHVLDWNEPAIRFYRSHGAVSNDDETHFKFAGEAFAELARGPAEAGA